MKSLMALVAALATATFLSSCTSSAGTSGDGHTDHQHGAESSTTDASTQPAQSNNADVAFATDMIAHHQQAVMVSALVPERSTDPAVIKLASEISTVQGPEIDTMKALLVQWNAGENAREDAGPEGHGGAMEGMQMPGMVDDATMTRLQSLKGTEFDRLFLQSMIGHHEGAIAMAKTEIADGVNPDAAVLAKQIVTGQQAEIAQMKQMLGE